MSVFVVSWTLVVSNVFFFEFLHVGPNQCPGNGENDIGAGQRRGPGIFERWSRSTSTFSFFKTLVAANVFFSGEAH
jgi:hypothetical protein